jgi:hypothetical protein
MAQQQNHHRGTPMAMILAKATVLSMIFFRKFTVVLLKYVSRLDGFTVSGNKLKHQERPRALS